MKWIASGNTSLPIDRSLRPWEPDKARERILRWAGFDKPQPSKRAAKAFLFVDRENWTKPDAYQLPIADVVDGELVVMPQAVEEAARWLSTNPETLMVPPEALERAWRKIQQIHMKIALQSEAAVQPILVVPLWQSPLSPSHVQVKG